MNNLSIISPLEETLLDSWERLGTGGDRADISTLEIIMTTLMWHKKNESSFELFVNVFVLKRENKRERRRKCSQMEQIFV